MIRPPADFQGFFLVISSDLIHLGKWRIENPLAKSQACTVASFKIVEANTQRNTYSIALCFRMNAMISAQHIFSINHYPVCCMEKM